MSNERSLVVSKSGIMWNAIGNIAVSMVAFIYSIVVSRVLGAEILGIYSTAVAIVNLLIAVGTYRVYSYQVTDIVKKYTLMDYIYTRIITIIMMWLFVAIYCMNKSYSAELYIILILLTIYEMINIIADVFHAQFQIEGRIDVVGKAKFIRSVTSIISFICALSIIPNIGLGIIVTIVVNIIGFLLYDFRYILRFKIEFNPVNISKVIGIIVECFPVFLSSFLTIYYLNAPKYALGKLMSMEIQGIYTIIYMPTFVLNLVTIFLIQPILPELSYYWEQKNGHKLKQKITNIILGVIGITILAAIGGYILGIPILQYIYKVELAGYKELFIMLIVTGGFNAAITVVQQTLISMRKQKLIVLNDMVGCIIMFFIVPIVINSYGLEGAVYIGLMISILLMFMYLKVFLRALEKGLENE